MVSSTLERTHKDIGVTFDRVAESVVPTIESGEPPCCTSSGVLHDERHANKYTAVYRQKTDVNVGKIQSFLSDREVIDTCEM